MKKILTITILAILFIAIAIPVLAADITTSINSSSSEVKAGDTISVTIGVNNFTRDGENKAIEGKLNFDTSVLTYEGVSYGTGWNGTISGDKTGVALYKTGSVAANEDVITLNFKVAENATAGSTAVAINNISTSADGDEIAASSSSKTITIAKTEEEPNEPEVKPSNTVGSNNQSDPTTANKKVDKAGIETLTISVIIAISIIGIVSYIRYRIINF